MTAVEQRPDVRAEAPAPAARRLGAASVLVALTAVLVLLGAWHLTQGTSGLGTWDLFRWALGDDSALNGSGVGTADVVMGSRLPRLAAGIAVGFGLGVAGCLFSSIARNPLASPDTLAVTGGAYLAVTAAAVLGWSLPVWGSAGVAFLGGIIAATLVLALAGSGTQSTRLVLAGAAVAMATQAATSTLLILFEEETTSLFAWGSGSLSQLGFATFRNALPVVVLVTVGALLMARRLDILSLGDDTAVSLGIPVRSTRVLAVLMAVLLTASAVTLAGPIGFVGLVAPVLVRALGRWIPGLLTHATLIPAAGLTGAVVVVGADALVRALLGAEEALAVPTGVATTLLGGVVMVALARTMRTAGRSRPQPTATRIPGRRAYAALVVLLVALLGASTLLGLVGGHTWLLAGDVVVWLRGEAGPLVEFTLNERSPRVIAAVAAGAALALSGTFVQATCRNPLAEPGLLGITGGAGLGAVIVVTASVSVAPNTQHVMLAGIAGAVAAFAVVYALAWRGGLDSDRLVLVGIGVWYTTTAASTFLLVRSNPWDTPRLFTWLSGTTYGRTWDQVVPVLVVLAVAVPVCFLVRRELDLLALDDDTPRAVGVRLEATRILVLGVAALLAATAVGAIGVVGFVGLVAPHAARALVGSRHSRVVGVAVLLGASLVVISDLVGRVVIAPAQVPVGLVVSLLGAPYFIWLLSRSRAS